MPRPGSLDSHIDRVEQARSRNERRRARFSLHEKESVPPRKWLVATTGFADFTRLAQIAAHGS